MNFEDLQIIWKNDEPLYAINRQTLHVQVKRHGRDVARQVNLAEGCTASIFLGLAVAVSLEPLVQGHDWHQLVDATIYLIVGAFLVTSYVLRKRLERDFEPSLRGDLEKALMQVEHHLSRWRAMLWWCMLPIGLTTLVSFSMLYDRKPVWIWPVVLIGLVVTYLMGRWEIRHKLAPRRENLQRLHKLLLTEPNTE